MTQQLLNHDVMSILTEAGLAWQVEGVTSEKYSDPARLALNEMLTSMVRTVSQARSYT